LLWIDVAATAWAVGPFVDAEAATHTGHTSARRTVSARNALLR
jgi:hypothetical protein